ncbi:hypothetical protein [Kordia sp.]|uniref:hypothetical protein n=1 Tax=Kordia sp. TaxID=1965332 RepID=UPI0025BB290F|nr:hypothetical protein [Kordia sp.]MCH2194377.1 hypothetical protein [Kordia sp.]
MSNQYNSVVVNPIRNGNNLNVMVGAQSGTNPAILTWIIVRQQGITRFFYPYDFNIRGQYVYPRLSQSKLFIPISPRDVKVEVY